MQKLVTGPDWQKRPGLTLPTLEAAWEEERREPSVATLTSVAAPATAAAAPSAKGEKGAKGEKEEKDDISSIKKLLETIQKDAKRDRDVNKERYGKFSALQKALKDDGYNSGAEFQPSSGRGGGGRGRGGASRGRGRGNQNSGEEKEE